MVGKSVDKMTKEEVPEGHSSWTMAGLFAQLKFLRCLVWLCRSSFCTPQILFQIRSKNKIKLFCCIKLSQFQIMNKNNGRCSCLQVLRRHWQLLDIEKLSRRNVFNVLYHVWSTRVASKFLFAAQCQNHNFFCLGS